MPAKTPDRHLSPALPVSLEAMLGAVDAHAIVSIADACGGIVHVNSRFCEISGYSEAELIGHNHRIVKSGEHPPEFYRQMWETISSGQVWQGEICNRHKQGGSYWVQATIVPCPGEDGLPTHYISLRTDITQQRLQVDHIARLAHEQGELLRLAPVGIARLEQRTFSALNEAFAAMLGYTVAELAGRSTRAIYFSDDQFRSVGDEAYEALRRGQIYKAEGSLRRKDGSDLWVIWGICSLTPETPTLNTLFIIQDISAHRAMEQQLAAALAESRSAERAKTAFLNAMSHEMHTPLNGILGVAQVLAMQARDEEERLLLDELTAAANHLLHMVDEALSLAAEEGLAPVALEERTVDEVVARCLWEARSLAAGWQVRLSGEIPPAVGQLRLRLDHSRLGQLLGLVMDNAVRYNRIGGQVTVTAAFGEAGLQLAISDTGVGMSSPQLARLGEPFVRFCADGNRPGAGLGISLAYRLAARLDAGLAVSSEPERGTQVRIALPAGAIVA